MKAWGCFRQVGTRYATQVHSQRDREMMIMETGKDLLMQATSPGLSPEQLCEELQNDQSDDMKRRRAIVAASMVGGVAMSLVSLL
jgi:hypothetical protein